jgi:outer membrane lipoprotein-sorting protein
MRAFGVGIGILLICSHFAGAEPAAPLINPVGPAQANPGTANAGVDAVLGQLSDVGKHLKDFSAKLKLTETDNTLGTETVRVGNVWFQKKPDGSARIHVLFNMRIDPATKTGYPKDKVEYLLDGPWLIDRNYQTQNEVKRQVLKTGQKMDLFKLGEGPFPLPIGQDPKDVHDLFDVKQIATAKDDPANPVHLELIPKPKTDLARKFHSLDVWVDPKTHMPARVDTTDVKQQTTRSTELNDIIVNPAGGLPDSNFQLINIDKENWNRHVESLND